MFLPLIFNKWRYNLPANNINSLSSLKHYNISWNSVQVREAILSNGSGYGEEQHALCMCALHFDWDQSGLITQF